MSRPLSRRRLLELAGVGGVAAVAAGSGGVLVARGGESTGTGTGGTVPFYGDHQAGILTPQQHHLQFASYDVTAANVAELRDLLGSWTGLAARLTRGEATPAPAAASSRLRTTPVKPVGSTRPGSRSRSASGRGCSTAASALPASGRPSWPIFPASRRTSSIPRNPAETSASRPARTTLRWRSTRSGT